MTLSGEEIGEEEPEEEREVWEEELTVGWSREVRREG